RTGLNKLNRPALSHLGGANQLDELGHDLDELVIVLADPAEQFDFVFRDELEPVEVVAELVKLTQRGLERSLVGDQERRGDAVELAGGVVLELAVGGDLALELDQVLGAPVHRAQRLQADRAHRDEQHDDGKERGQEFRVDRDRYPRDESNKPRRHYRLISRSRLFRSPNNSSGSNRTPRYCTRRIPSLSMSDVRKV